MKLLIFLRPIAATTAGTVGAAIPGVGPVTGPAFYTGADYLMQQLKREQTTPGQKLVNTGLQALLGKLFDLGGQAVGAVRNSGVPDPLSSFKPTTSQVMNANGVPGASVVRMLEDNLTPGSKAKDLVESGKAASREGQDVAASIAGRSTEEVTNPHEMVRLINGQLVPESDFQKIAIKPRTAPVQPVKVVKDTAEVQPIKIVPDEAPYRPSQTRVTGLPEQVETSGTQTRVTGPQEQVEVPGSYEVLPGVAKKVPFATDPKSMDKLVSDPVRLQDALTRSQQAGLGTNVRQDLGGYRFSRVLQNATKPDGSLDIGMARAAFENPDFTETNKILYGSRAASDINQFFKNASFVDGKVSPNGTLRKILLRADGVVLPFALIHSAITGSTSGLATSGTAVGLQITASGLTRLFTRPESARIMVKLAGAEPLGMSDAFAAKIILRGLQGTASYLIGKDGQKEELK
jgi:hypothetical protein